MTWLDDAEEPYWLTKVALGSTVPFFLFGVSFGIFTGEWLPLLGMAIGSVLAITPLAAADYYIAPPVVGWRKGEEKCR